MQFSLKGGVLALNQDFAGCHLTQLGCLATQLYAKHRLTYADEKRLPLFAAGEHASLDASDSPHFADTSRQLVPYSCRRCAPMTLLHFCSKSCPSLHLCCTGSGQMAQLAFHKLQHAAKCPNWHSICCNMRPNAPVGISCAATCGLRFCLLWHICTGSRELSSATCLLLWILLCRFFTQDPHAPGQLTSIMPCLTSICSQHSITRC